MGGGEIQEGFKAGQVLQVTQRMEDLVVRRSGDQGTVLSKGEARGWGPKGGDRGGSWVSGGRGGGEKGGGGGTFGMGESDQVWEEVRGD